MIGCQRKKACWLRHLSTAGPDGALPRVRGRSGDILLLSFKSKKLQGMQSTTRHHWIQMNLDGKSYVFLSKNVSLKQIHPGTSFSWEYQLQKHSLCFVPLRWGLTEKNLFLCPVQTYHRSYHRHCRCTTFSGMNIVRGLTGLQIVSSSFSTLVEMSCFNNTAQHQTHHLFTGAKPENINSVERKNRMNPQNVLLSATSVTRKLFHKTILN